MVGRQAGVVANGGTGGFEMGACGVELTAAELEVGTLAQRHVWVVRGHRAKRVGAGLIGSVPFAEREQGLDPVRCQDGVVRPIGTHRGEPRFSCLGGLPGPSEHRQHVGERDVGLLQCNRVANLLGDLEGLVELREALLGATEIGKVAAERAEHSDFDIARADHAGELERLLADRTGLVVTPHDAEPAAERCQGLRPFGRRRVCWDDLDGALEGGEEGVAAAALEQVTAEPLVQERRARRSRSRRRGRLPAG